MFNQKNLTASSPKQIRVACWGVCGECLRFCVYTEGGFRNESFAFATSKQEQHDALKKSAHKGKAMGLFKTFEDKTTEQSFLKRKM